MSTRPTHLPVEIIQEFAICVLCIDLAAAFNPYAPPVDSCILRPPTPPAPSVDLSLPCIQGGAHPIHYAGWDIRDVGFISPLVVEQARGATRCTKRPTTSGLFINARKLILVSKSWYNAIRRDWRLWPQDQQTVFPLQFFRGEESPSYVVFDPLCSCAYQALPDDWLEHYSHINMSLPRLCSIPNGYHGYGPRGFIDHFIDSRALTHIELRGAFPTSRLPLWGSSGCPINVPNLEVARLINCEVILCGPRLRVLYFVALFAELLPIWCLLECLSDSPQLEVFHLGTADLRDKERRGDDPRNQDAPPPAIPLKRLRHLDISLPTDTLLEVLFMLELPPSIDIHLEGLSGDESEMRKLVPPLLMPEKARRVIGIDTSDAGYRRPEDVFGALQYDWREYTVMGLDVGLDRSRKAGSLPSQYYPEYIQVVLAGDVGSALACLANTANGAAATATEAGSSRSSLPRRSLGSRMHTIKTPSHRSRPRNDRGRLYSPLPNVDGIGLTEVTGALRRYLVPHEGETLVIGPGSYTPQSPLEWCIWLAEFRPSTVVIPAAMFEFGREVTPRGMAELQALALYLKDGCEVVRWDGKAELQCNRTIVSICVSPECLGDRPEIKLAALTRCSHPGTDILTKRPALTVQWSLLMH